MSRSNTNQTSPSWPARSESMGRYLLSLIVYTLMLSFVFVQFPKSDAVEVKIILVGLGVGIVIGVWRETSLRMRYRKYAKSQKADV